METIAVYSEDRIKTYGLQEIRGLSIICVNNTAENLTRIGSALTSLEEQPDDFFLVMIRNRKNNPPGIYIVLKKPREKTLRNILNDGMGRDEKVNPVMDSSAGVIYFQGPHFGDRYGIADTALKALDKERIPILAAGCTGASMYFVFPESGVEKARNTLNAVFEIPGQSKK